MSITITKKKISPFAGIWVNGTTDDGCKFQAKVFEEPSQFGIPTARFEDGGNVSKLYIKAHDGRELLCYDRGFDYIDDAGEDYVEDVMHEIVLDLEKRFCKQ